MSRWIIAIMSLVFVLVTLEFQRLFPGRPPFHINALPCALFYLSTGFLSCNILEKVSAPKVIGVAFLFVGWRLQISYSGNIGQINSYWYYVESSFSIVGLYILVRKYNLQYVQVMRRAGELSLYILGIHSLISKDAGLFAQYILDTMSVKSDFLQHALSALNTFILSLAIAEIYIVLKNGFIINCKIFRKFVNLL